MSVDAWLRYGEGRHAAAPYFGNCLASLMGADTVTDSCISQESRASARWWQPRSTNHLTRLGTPVFLHSMGLPPAVLPLPNDHRSQRISQRRVEIANTANSEFDLLRA